VNLSNGELALYTFLLIGPVISIIAVIDSANRPGWAFQQAGFEKVLWVTLAALGIVFTWFGVIGAIWYLASVRPKVAVAQATPRWQAPPPPPSARVAPTLPPPEWLPDPTRRHELRYWDGAQWSEHVSDRGVQSWDRV
jgi:hypothetical protein